MKIKSAFKSKTFWINLVVLLLSIGLIFDSDFLTQIGIDPANQVKVLAYVGAVMAILNKVLRFLTISGITFSKNKISK